MKLTVTKETYENGGARRSDAVVAGIATFYTLFLIYAAGPDKLLLSCILYAVGAALYVMARRERGLQVFTRAEAVFVRHHHHRRGGRHRIAGHRHYHDLTIERIDP